MKIKITVEYKTKPWYDGDWNSLDGFKKLFKEKFKYDLEEGVVEIQSIDLVEN